MNRPLDTIIEALDIAGEEFQFHSERLSRGDVRGETTGEEEAHLEDLGNLYKDAARACGVLRRYQEGRKARQQARVQGSGIDGNGAARAVTEDGELEVAR